MAHDVGFKRNSFATLVNTKGCLVQHKEAHVPDVLVRSALTGDFGPKWTRSAIIANKIAEDRWSAVEARRRAEGSLEGPTTSRLVQDPLYYTQPKKMQSL